MTDTSDEDPVLLVQMYIEPSRFRISSDPSLDPPSISLKVTSTLDRPVTIFTWPTVFNLDLSQRRSNFSCQDLTTESDINLELTKGPKRPGFSRKAGGRDDAYFITLEPLVATTFTAPFKLAGWKDVLCPSHRYRFAVKDGEHVKWWRYGRKVDLMASEGEQAGLGEASGGPIALKVSNAAEFAVLE